MREYDKFSCGLLMAVVSLTRVQIGVRSGSGSDRGRALNIKFAASEFPDHLVHKVTIGYVPSRTLRRIVLTAAEVMPPSCSPISRCVAPVRRQANSTARNFAAPEHKYPTRRRHCKLNI